VYAKEVNMGVQSYVYHEKVKMTIECTADERAYIKMLAAKAHLNLSDLILSYLRVDFPHKPNKDTRNAMKELDEGGGHSFDSHEDFWEQMGMNPDAR
jgi:hypothetical protein